ncbi:aminotransferase [Russula vinacea]|nr:aminotransferase [Russula vinacea]
MSSFQLTSAIRYDPLYAQPSPFFLLPNHFDRLRAAAALHGWQDTLTSLSWSSFQSTCNCAVQEYDGPAKGGPLKLRLVLHRAGTITVTITPTTNRGHYQAARARFGLPDAGGMITETSVRNLAFFRHCRWVTPHDSTGCLPGVMRRQLLEQGLVLTDDRGLLSRDNVRDGELVIVFNAVEGCRIAVAHVRKV